MNNNKLVSIIIPIYNAKNYLVKCIESILNQSYKNIELILIDSGSSDGSKLICEEYVNKDNRIVYREEKVDGPSAARNIGISMSNGDFIEFIDSDDYLELDSIGVMVDEIGEADILIASYNNIYLRNEGNIKITRYSKESGFFNKRDFLDMFGDLLNNEMFHYVWNKLYKSSVIKGKMQFKENMKIAEDIIFNMDYVNHVNTVKIINKPIYNHVWYNENSITKQYHHRLFNIRKSIHNELEEFLITNNSYHNKNRQAIEKLYFKRIMGCFNNLLKPGSEKLNKNEKINEIKIIVDDDSVRNILDYFNTEDRFIKLVGMLIKYRMSDSIYYVYSLRNDIGKYSSSSNK